MEDSEFFSPQELQSHIKIFPGMKVADFGSGSGEIALELAALVGEDGLVTAIDVLQNALENLQAKAKAKDLKNIDIIRADLEAANGSKLSDSSQDVVFLANILWQSRKQTEILKEAFRILKPGGHIFALEWEKETRPMGPPPEMRVGKENLQKLAEQVGLKTIEVVPAGKYHYALIAQKP